MNKYLTKNYQRVERIDPKIIDDLKTRVTKDDKYYPSFHIAPQYGLLNDPNGLCYFNEEYHIFYQHCPNGPFHGMKSWHHLTTKDFITYTDRGLPLTATNSYDNYGVYSGGAYVKDEQLVLLYTGNERKETENYKRYPNQCYAIMNKEYQIIERDVFLKPDFKMHTEHFRDPVKFKNDIIIGAQDTFKNAQIAIYNPENQTLEYLKNNLPTNNAYMYECPNVTVLDEYEILVYSPQGLEHHANSNIYEVYYSLGQLGDIENRNWSSSVAKKMDSGFDFYAPQIFQDEHRTLMIGWLGQAGDSYPVDEKCGWSQMLTIPRVLSVKEGKLYQQPAKEVDQLIISSEIISGVKKLDSKAFKLSFDTESNFTIKFGNKDFYIQFSKEDKQLILDRSNTNYSINPDFGLVRTLEINTEEVKIEMYIDYSALEIFVNNGEQVLTSRFLIEKLEEIELSGLSNVELNYIKPIKIKERDE